MTLHWIDITIVIVVMGCITAVAVGTKKYTQSVADFLSANRCAGRYLLCVAGGMANLGAISIVAQFEVYYAVGFTASWWAEMITPVGLIIVISGWVAYRYRETRCLTIAQFFEVRYNKRLRIFAGTLAWFSGIVNFGIFPAVGTRFSSISVGFLPRCPARRYRPMWSPCWPCWRSPSSSSSSGGRSPSWSRISCRGSSATWPSWWWWPLSS